MSLTPRKRKKRRVGVIKMELNEEKRVLRDLFLESVKDKYLGCKDIP